MIPWGLPRAMCLGVRLPDSTHWALPYVVLEDDGKDIGN